MYIRKAKVTKTKIGNELYYVLELPVGYSFVMGNAEKFGGKIFGKEIAPTNAVSYIRIMKQVCKKKMTMIMKIFIREKDFLNGKVSCFSYIHVVCKGFPPIEVKASCKNLKISREVKKEMERLIGGINRRE